MVNFSTFTLSEVSGPGGLFDFDATLPLVAIQFLLLMVILNIVLYSPLLGIIFEREEFILTNLATASYTLAQANKLTAQNEQDLARVQKQGQLENTNSEKFYKEIFEIELNISQKYIDNLLDTITKDLLDKKNVVFNNLETIVPSLFNEIETILSI